MGYSGRYHAASLAAVFIALAIGILIGIGLADDVVSSASEELENSLREDRDAAQDQAADLQAELDREQEFSEAATRALISGRLNRQRAALVYLGSAPGDEERDTAAAATDAIGDAGGTLASVSSIPLPADVGPLIDATGKRFAAARRDPIALRDLGRAIGARLAGGGDLIERVKPDLFATFNGSLDGVTRIVMISDRPELAGGDLARAHAFERGVLEGVLSTARGSAGVELTDTDPTTLDPFIGAGMSTVDDVDSPAGRVALVYALTGARGDFGIKDEADSLIPQPLRPARAAGR